ncbi:MAG: manganese efflux pump MntP family protein [Sarcina sp.]
MLILSAFIFSLSSNIDNLVIGISYGIKEEKISMLSNIIIAIITTLGTYISMEFGKFICRFISHDISNLFGAITLLLMGAYFVTQSIIEKEKDKKVEKKKVTKLSAKDTILLALALASNNLGVGVAASITGLGIKWVLIFTFITSILTISIGQSLGDHVIGKFIGKYDSLISGILLVLLGVLEIF